MIADMLFDGAVVPLLHDVKYYSPIVFPIHTLNSFRKEVHKVVELKILLHSINLILFIQKSDVRCFRYVIILLNSSYSKIPLQYSITYCRVVWSY